MAWPLGDRKSRMRAREAFNAMLNQCFADQKGPAFVSSLSVCFFNFLFFYFTNNRSEENHPQMLQPWSKSMCSSAPRGRNCVEGRCNNRDVLEIPPEVLRNIHVPWKYSLFFFLPTTVSLGRHFSIQHSLPRERESIIKKKTPWERKSQFLTWEFRIWNSQLRLGQRVFASQKLNRNLLLQQAGHRKEEGKISREEKGAGYSVCHTQQVWVRKAQWRPHKVAGHLRTFQRKPGCWKVVCPGRVTGNTGSWTVVSQTMRSSPSVTERPQNEHMEDLERPGRRKRSCHLCRQKLRGLMRK